MVHGPHGEHTDAHWAWLVDGFVLEGRSAGPQLATDSVLIERAIDYYEIRVESRALARDIAHDVLAFPARFATICKSVILPSLNASRSRSPYGALARTTVDLGQRVTQPPDQTFSKNASVGLRLEFGPHLKFIAWYPSVMVAVVGAGGTPFTALGFDVLTEREAQAFFGTLELWRFIAARWHSTQQPRSTLLRKTHIGCTKPAQLRIGRWWTW